MLKKAVIPAAGLGTRLLPITRVVPKELFPLGDRPVIQHVVEEAVAAGLTEICVVIRRGKEMIRDYFTREPFAPLSRVAALRELAARCTFTFVEQAEPAGLGDALLASRDFVQADRFVMLVPDQILPRGCTQLVAADDGSSIVSTVVRIHRRDLSHFSGARGFSLRDTGSRRYAVERLLTDAESSELYRGEEYEFRGFGRTVFPPSIFEYLGRQFVNAATGEVDLLKTFETAAPILGHIAIVLDGEPADVGSFGGYYRYLSSYAGAAA